MAQGVGRAGRGNTGDGGDTGEDSAVVFHPQRRGASAEQREQAGVWGVARKVGWGPEECCSLAPSPT